MGRPHRKYGTDTVVVGVRLTPEEAKMLDRLRGPKNRGDALRACLETVHELRENDDAVDGLFEQIMRGE